MAPLQKWQPEQAFQTFRVGLRNYNRFMEIALACARSQKPVSDLTEEEKFAICVAVGVPLRTELGKGYFLNSETAMPCAISLTNGRYVVSMLEA